MNRIPIALGVAVILVLGAAAAWQSAGETVNVPPPTTESETAPTAVTEPAPALNVKAVSVTPAKPRTTTSFALREGDTVASWDFKGAYTGTPELVTKARNEIKSLTDLLATATSSYMIIAVGIANQYELLGDGKNQYDYLGRAIQASPENGLPWHNLGVLMERLGALRTARAAHENAALLNPQLAVYHFAYIEFLIQNMKNDTEGIEKAFTTAEENIGPKPYLAELRAQWQNP